MTNAVKILYISKLLLHFELLKNKNLSMYKMNVLINLPVLLFYLYFFLHFIFWVNFNYAWEGNGKNVSNKIPIKCKSLPESNVRQNYPSTSSI